MTWRSYKFSEVQKIIGFCYSAGINCELEESAILYSNSPVSIGLSDIDWITVDNFLSGIIEKC